MISREDSSILSKAQTSSWICYRHHDSQRPRMPTSPQRRPVSTNTHNQSYQSRCGPLLTLQQVGISPSNCQSTTPCQKCQTIKQTTQALRYTSGAAISLRRNLGIRITPAVICGLQEACDSLDLYWATLGDSALEVCAALWSLGTWCLILATT